MYLLFPFLGAVLSYTGLYIAGPPIVYGEWQPLPIFLWLILVGFGVRLIAACFGIAPENERQRHED